MKSPGSQGWLLVCGFALVAIGLVRGAVQTSPGQIPTTQVLPVASVANADSNNRMIAVTGSDITGASILYLVDTVTYHLAVYQASGGAESTRGIKLVGARNIDLDLQLDGLYDQSEWTYAKLKDKFAQEGLLPETEH